MKNLSPYIPLAALAAVVALALPVSAAARGSKAQHETAQGPGVTAQLDWVKRSTYEYGHTRLTIVRDGVTAADRVKVASACLALSWCRWSTRYGASACG